MTFLIQFASSVTYDDEDLPGESCFRFFVCNKAAYEYIYVYKDTLTYIYVYVYKIFAHIDMIRYVINIHFASSDEYEDGDLPGKSCLRFLFVTMQPT
jgi:hypothetical protein